jgi:hypothetical protein
VLLSQKVVYVLDSCWIQLFTEYRGVWRMGDVGVRAKADKIDDKSDK